MAINYLSLRNSNLSSFNAITINYSTLAGSTITGSTIASISTIRVSTIFNSTINASRVNYSTLVGSTISTITFRASTIGIGTAPTASPMTVFNTRTTPYTNAPTMTISDGAPITTGTYGMVHLTRPSGVLDYKGYLTFIRNGSTNVQMMGYLQNSDTFGWIVTNATSNPMNTLNGIFMDSNGNVGIGVTNPTYKLHVVGSIYADNLNMSYFNAIGGQKAGGIFFTGDTPAAQWQIAIIGDHKLGFNINNTGTDGYSPSYTPVITFGNTGSITCGAINSGSITLNNTNVPLYLYNFGPTNYSAIYADAGGTMTFATGTGGVGTRMTIAPSGTVTVNNEMISTGLNANHFRAVQGSYGVILRNDGGRFYFLTTAANDPYGSWGTTRPFSFDLSNGRLFSDNGQTFSGGLTVNGGLNVSGGLTVNGGFNVVPIGVIVMWYGSQASIPSGWAICNGGNGTPNLLDRFIVGAGYSYGVGAQGGENVVTLTTAQIPSHTHNYYLERTSRCVGYTASYNSSCEASGPLYGTTLTTDGGTGSGQAHENRPPYYALCYIMRIV